ncbi:hypothetical protein DEU56DRAFT_783905 [Suillus clintonianus]|uniref:uncharacterized protein n=1 Tax=Suillus clintonianus TaxID=1904413 RepID=UPI001B875604|nr:uncharacterized protein DEU56DRAFT_783905 [Suillus clintonianus]KAG2148056.1 hypothetical protein DEU56DRAFT_783905 [Suillus clintonianus]
MLRHCLVPLLVPSVLRLPPLAAFGTSSSPLDIALQQGGPLRCNNTPNTVSSGKKRIYIAPPPVKANSKAQTGQSPSAVAQPASQPHSTPQHQPEAQTATQQPPQEEDYGC